MRTLLTVSAATIALIIAAPTAAQRGNGGGPAPGTPMGGPSVNVPVGGGTVPGVGPSNSVLDARMNSQGPANASPTGIQNASPNSVLNTNSTIHPTDHGDDLHHTSGDHHGSTAHHPGSHDPLDLHTGLTVFTSAGHTLGTITHVITDAHGMITGVIVTSATGHTYTLAASTLSLSGGMLITSLGG